MKIYAVIGLLLLGACGGHKGKGLRFITKKGLSREQATDALYNLDVDCGISGGCPQNVGMLGFIHPDDNGTFGVGLCTTFKVGPNMMATNSHCIPKNIKSAGADCSDWIRFKTTSGDNHVCDKILYASPIADEHRFTVATPDFAFYTLKTSIAANAFAIDTSGFTDKESITTYSVDPRHSNADGTLLKKTCDTRYESQGFSEPLYGFPVIDSVCNIISGNSGSPIVKSSGAVAGIIFAAAVEAPKVGFGINFSCIDINNLTSPWKTSSHCPTSSSL